MGIGAKVRYDYSKYAHKIGEVVCIDSPVPGRLRVRWEYVINNATGEKRFDGKRTWVASDRLTRLSETQC